ncbi:MAG: hypothetical protein HY881_14010 [Deltaproteobacteria bacterium]|nr:hypothetical protein [Deltaproteobacteria bacterium]
MTNSTSARALKFFWGSISVFIVATVLCGCTIRKTEAPESFAIEEKRLPDMIDNAQDSNALSDWYLSRARQRVRTNNPHPDYGGALKDFTASLNLNPTREDGGDIRDWIAVLSKLAKLEKSSIHLKSQYEKARQENLSLKINIERLEKQEEELRKSIEDLQSLELQMEQRRQQLR